MNALRVVQIAPWLLFLLVLFIGGHADHYIVPWQQDLVLVGGGILLVLVLWGAAAGLRRPKKGYPFAEVAIHFVPVFILVSLGPTAMDAQQLARTQFLDLDLLRDQKTAGDSAVETGPAVPSVALIPDESYLHTGQGPGQNPMSVDDGLAQDPLLAIYTGNISLGDSVILTGRLLRADADQGLPGALSESPAQRFLYRFAITCCAADAAGLAVALTGDAAAGLDAEHDSWIEVHGVLHDFDERQLGIIRLVSWKSIPPLQQPYLQLQR